MAELRKLIAASAASLTVIAVTAVPGSANPVGTPASITINSTGSIGVSGPAGTADLGSTSYSSDTTAVTWPTTSYADVGAAATGLAALADFSGSLGNVTVTDSRTGVLPSWTATVSWTDFKLDPTSTADDEVIAAAQIRYLSGATSSSIDASAGVFVPSLTPVATGGTGASFTGAGLTGSTVVWNPTIFVDLQGELPGTYEGTVTHSVTAS